MRGGGSRAPAGGAAKRSASAVCGAGGHRPSARPYMCSPFACRRKDPVMPPPTDARALLDALVAKARRAGADAADAVLFEGVSLSHAQRLGNTEKLERSESYDLGLRVLLGKRQAIVSSNDRGAERFDELVARAIAMAKAVPEDPYCGLASPEEIARGWPDLDLVDSAEPTPE